MTRTLAARVIAVALIAFCWTAATGQALPQTGAQAGTLDSGPLPGAAPAQAAASPTTPYANPSMLYPGEDFHLDPGDLILVHVFMQDFSQTARLGADGSVHLPFIGSVPLQGLTVRAAQALIVDRLRAGGFYKDPEVTIQVLDTVNGSVLVTGDLLIPLCQSRRRGA